MTSDRLDVRGIEPEIIENFKKFVLDKHGKLHTALGKEVGKALLAYMEGDIPNREYTHTHAHEEEQLQKKKKDLQLSPYHARLTAIQEKMRTVGGWDTDSFQDGLAVRYIKEICGGDARTINKYYSDLQTKWSIEH